MALDVTGKTFTEVHNAFKSGPSKSGQHVRGRVTRNTRQLYTHTALMPNGSGNEALIRRRQKYAEGARLIKQTMIKEYGDDLARAVFAKVKAGLEEATGRNLEEGVTRGDLELLQEELQLQEPQHKMLQLLRTRVTQDGPEAIIREMAENWASASKQEYHPVQWPDDATVVGLRPTMYELKEPYFLVQWPNNDANAADANAAEVGFRHIIYLDHVAQGSMEFDDKKGTLTLTRHRRVDGAEDNEEKNLTALTEFIGRHFKVKPGQPAFQNIANNILSYLPRRKSLDVAEMTAREVTRGAARADGIASLRTFTLSVTADGNVDVDGDTRIPYRNFDGDPVRPVDFSKYRFVRQDSFEISREHLMVDPTAFEAGGNLVSVGRSDKIEWAS